MKRLLQNDWAAGLFLLAVFLLTNGYAFPWDDQHLEVPLLKSLIDPGLYPGDYYVSSLKQNVITFFYPLLARFITIDQIPAVYFLLYLVSRFFLFFFSYKLWRHISGDRLTALCCVLSLILVGRVEEFLYRTFSHQELALAVVAAGIYLFYKERFLLAAVVLGLAANLHALYSLFPFVYLMTYLFLNTSRWGWQTLFKSFAAFVILLTPLLFWVIHKFTTASAAAAPPAFDDWHRLYMLACPQNYLFYNVPLNELFKSWAVFFNTTKHYLLILALFALNFVYNEHFRKDKKIQAAFIGGLLMIAFSFVFTYIVPSRFVIDLNLIRNIQYFLFFLTGYTAILIVNTVKNKPPAIGMAAAILFIFFESGKYNEATTILAATALFFLLWMTKLKEQNKRDLSLLAGAAAILSVAFILLINILKSKMAFFTQLNLAAAPVVLLVGFLFPRFRKTLVFVPIVFIFLSFSFFHYRMLDIIKTGPGFWQMQRNWEDMQRYVKANTPKNTLLMVPHDMEMGGFRILSERPVVVCYRDCGVIGFDYPAAVEWERRLNELEAFKVFVRGPVAQSIVTGVFKYKVNYIVFMNYAQPRDQISLFEKIYENEVFSLYKVVPNSL